MKVSIFLNLGICIMLGIGLSCPVNAAEKSPYMGGDVNLTKAPNGAITREEDVLCCEAWPDQPEHTSGLQEWCSQIA